MTQADYEVIIIGGSYAGLSAALALGRARRKVLIIDGGKPANRFTPYAHNILTRDGTPPAELRRLAKADVESYPTVSYLNNTVVAVNGAIEYFEVTTSKETTVSSRRIIIATGVVDEIRELPGLKECWGVSVIHCPYCHGYEFSDQATGYLNNSPMLAVFPKLLRQWTDNITVYTEGPTEFAESLESLSGVSVDRRVVKGIAHEDGYIRHLVFADGSQRPLKALYYHPPFALPTDRISGLDLALTETGHIQINEEKATNQPGIYAIGDCTTPFRSVPNAVAAGNMVGVHLNHELLAH